MSDLAEIPDELQRIATDLASRFGVNGTIHARDYIFWFEYDLSPEDDKNRAAHSYIGGGRDTAHVVKDWLLTHRPSRQDFSILDFASGYGRVTRFLNEAMPHARVSAADIHPEAIAFIRSMGIDGFVSSSIPEDFRPPKKFDVIFSMSFLTHMPRPTWGRWLKVLVASLETDGLLVFTTHGLPIWEAMGRPVLDSDGFFFRAVSEQRDIDVQEYGNTITSARFVVDQLATLPLHLESLRSPGLGLHDVWFARRIEPTRIPTLASPKQKSRWPLKRFRKAIRARWRGVTRR